MKSSWRPYLIAGIVVVLVLSATALIDSLARDSNISRLREELGEDSDSLSHRISAVVARESDAIEALAAIFEIAEGDRTVLDDQFPIFAEVLMESGDTLLSVQLGPDSILDYVYPHEGNEAALGLDLMADPERRRLLEPTIETGETTIQGPTGLVQGGIGLLVRKPLYLQNGEFWGFAETVLDWPSVADRVGLRDLESVDLAIRDPETLTILTGDPDVFEGNPVIRTVAIGATDTVWQLATRPSGGWPAAAPMTPYIWIIGALVGAFLGRFAYYLAKRPEALREERERALADLRVAEKLFAEAFDKAGVGIVTTDLEGKILTMNSFMRHLLGLSDNEDLNELSILEFLDLEGKGWPLSELASLSDGEKKVEADLTLNPVTWIHARATYSPSVGEDMRQVMVIVENVTQARMAERALAQSEERFRELFVFAPVAIHREDHTDLISELETLRAKGITEIEPYLCENANELQRLLSLARIIEMNPTAIALAERLGQELPCSVVSTFLSVETEPDLVEEIKMLWDSRLECEASISVTDRDGEVVHLSVRRFVPKSEDGPDYSNMMVTSSDVTEIIEANKRLEQMLQSKDRFLASVAHELRTPLTAVVGFANHLQEWRETLKESERDEFEDVISLHASEMSHVIDDLLVWARADIGEVQVNIVEMDLGVEARRAVATVPSIELGIDEPDNPVEVLGDAVRVRQIVRNLVTNAVRYGGDSISVRVRNGGHQGFLEVTDDGEPIPECEMKKVFEPYARVSAPRAEPGSIGIGLTVSRSLARLQGGDLIFFRDDGLNVFRLSLPLIEQLRLL